MPSELTTTVLPLRIVSGANLREHWSAKAKRAQEHRLAPVYAFGYMPNHVMPARVTLTRIAPRALDDDNLQYACKALRDGVADVLGVKDNDPRVTWAYGQERGRAKEYAVRVTIEARAE